MTKKDNRKIRYTPDQMPTELIETQSPDNMSISSFFKMPQTPNHEMAGNSKYNLETTGDSVLACEFLKTEIIHKHYVWAGTGRRNKKLQNKTHKGFRCRCCGYQNPNTDTEISWLAMFKRIKGAPLTCEVDGIILPLPEKIELASNCMKDRDEVIKSLEQQEMVKNMREMQIKWLVQCFSNPKYTYIGCHYHSRNLERLNKVIANIREGSLAEKDISTLYHFVFFNMERNKQPFRIYKNIGLTSEKMHEKISKYANANRLFGKNLVGVDSSEIEYIEIEANYIREYLMV